MLIWLAHTQKKKIKAYISQVIIQFDGEGLGGKKENGDK